MIAISMDGKGRCLDNVFVERLWHEEVYLHAYGDVREAWAGIGRWLALLQPGTQALLDEPQARRTHWSRHRQYARTVAVARQHASYLGVLRGAATGPNSETSRHPSRVSGEPERETSPPSARASWGSTAS